VKMKNVTAKESVHRCEYKLHDTMYILPFLAVQYHCLGA